jgi:hypothetical protein
LSLVTSRSTTVIWWSENAVEGAGTAHERVERHRLSVDGDRIGIELGEVRHGVGALVGWHGPQVHQLDDVEDLAV